jgi:hypothetical protein
MHWNIILLLTQIHSKISHSSFLQLLSYNSPVNDSFIHSYTSRLTSTSQDIKAVDTNFSRDLTTFGWQSAFKKYFLHNTSSKYAKLNVQKQDLHLIPLSYLSLYM